MIAKSMTVLLDFLVQQDNHQPAETATLLLQPGTIALGMKYTASVTAVPWAHS